MLTNYNGTTITYDAIGNPLNWRDGITNVTWNGRQLNSLVKGNYTYSYQYNADGIRTQKTKWYTGTSVAEITHYVLDGTKIVKEYRTTSANGTQTNVKYYFYDASGSIAGFEYNGNTYYFQKNIQGDIIRICDTSGNTVAEYTYDAWGKILSIKDGSGNDVSGNASHIANINPFRYRGYYYDSETGFYYLQTRYYDPVVGRFLNADGYISTGQGIIGNNMFAYCGNSPVFSVDPNGDFFLSALLICTIGGAIIGGAIGGIANSKYADSQGYTGSRKTWCVLQGIFCGGFLGGVAGYYAAPLVTAATGFYGVSITAHCGIVILSIDMLGQDHHVLSNPIINALNNHPTLKGLFQRVGSIVRALYENAHKGYQEWHRIIDQHMVNWLNSHPNANAREFWLELYDQYNTKDMIKRFGEGVLEYIKEQLKNAK